MKGSETLVSSSPFVSKDNVAPEMSVLCGAASAVTVKPNSRHLFLFH